MMKVRFKIKIFSVLVILIYGNPLWAQMVGINTNYAKQLVHIDAKGNTLSITADIGNESLDDIVINNNGNVGVGRLSPTAKLDIYAGTNPALAKAFRLEDGNEGVNKGLISNANGFATWQALDFGVYKVVAYQAATSAIPSAGYPLGNGNLYSGLSLKFPEPGNYLVSIGIKVSIQGTIPNPENMQVQATIQPTNVRADWAVRRFVGAYPVMSSNISLLENRIILIQQITIPADNLTAYLMLTFWHANGNQFQNAGQIITSWGNGGVTPEAHRVGGSFVKIQ